MCTAAYISDRSSVAVLSEKRIDVSSPDRIGTGVWGVCSNIGQKESNFRSDNLEVWKICVNTHTHTHTHTFSRA